MKIKEIRSKTSEELQSKVAELRRELVKERAQVALGSQLKSPRKIYQLRKTIAQMLTLLHERVSSKAATPAASVQKIKN